MLVCPPYPQEHIHTQSEISVTTFPAPKPRQFQGAQPSQLLSA